MTIAREVALLAEHGLNPAARRGEFKLYGSAVEVGQDHDSATVSDRGGWPFRLAIMFCLRIKQALFVDWDTGMA